MAKPFSKNWRTQKEYEEFSDKHKVFGMDAVNLKKKMDKQIIPMPILRKTK